MRILNNHLLTIFLSILAIIISSFTHSKAEQYRDLFVKTNPKYKHHFKKLLLDRTSACIMNDSEMTQKEDILALLNCLEQNGSISEWGGDDLRVKYVLAQGAFEHVLACAMVLGDIDSLVGFIHTPTPATPLCTKVDNLDTQLLDSSIRSDLEKLLTVQSRAVVVREYLEKGGKLFIAYPGGGLEKRTPQQQEVYFQELVKYEDRLFDAVLSCKEMDPNMIGASYFFKDLSGEVYVFSIKATQANQPKANSEWGLWLGKINDPIIEQRMSALMDYLELHDGPNMRQELLSL